MELGTAGVCSTARGGEGVILSKAPPPGQIRAVTRQLTLHLHAAPSGCLLVCPTPGGTLIAESSCRGRGRLGHTFLAASKRNRSTQRLIPQCRRAELAGSCRPVGGASSQSCCCLHSQLPSWLVRSWLCASY